MSSETPSIYSTVVLSCINTTLYEFVEMHELYNSLKSNLDIKKNLDKNIDKNLKVLLISFKKAKRLQEEFGDKFAKYISISSSTLYNANIELLIEFLTRT
ncbi:3143_t:CDS:2 [Gigaspora rosea]|nr:3143_t:CDS:2 [Gigaspora rosea]